MTNRMPTNLFGKIFATNFSVKYITNLLLKINLHLQTNFNTDFIWSMGMAYTILYIEDNIDDKALIQRILENKGYELVWAADGRSGIELAEKNPPDIILLDINLPDIDGYTVANHIRNNGNIRLEYIPIIAITANSLRGDAEKALAAGCDVYISKPININELWSRIDDFLSD